MSAFDPELAGKMVADYAPARPAKFQDLLPARNVIAELRQKGASYRAIADLLSRHNLTTSKTAVTEFCHEVLGEISRPNKRRPRKRPPASNLSESEPLSTITTPSFLPMTGNPGENQQPRVRGPHIAQIRRRKPNPHETS